MGELEGWIDELSDALPPLKQFILPVQTKGHLIDTIFQREADLPVPICTWPEVFVGGPNVGHID